MLIEIEMSRKSLESMTSFKIFTLLIKKVMSCSDLVCDLVTELAHGRLKLVTSNPAILRKCTIQLANR